MEIIPEPQIFEIKKKIKVSELSSQYVSNEPMPVFVEICFISAKSVL